jgi:signal transduction histidine kinase
MRHHAAVASTRDTTVGRWGPTLATGAAVLSSVAVVLALGLHRGNAGVPGVSRFWLGDAVVGAVYPLVGAFLVRRRPTNPVGWILTSAALVGIYAVGGQWYVRSVLVEQRPLPLAELGGWLNAWGWMPHLLLPTLVPLLFPDGSLPSRRWRWLVLTVSIGVALTALTGMLAPVPLDASEALTNPWGVLPEAVARPLMTVGLFLCFAIGAPAAIASVVVRLRRSRGTQRTQLLWLLAGGLLLILSLVVQAVLPAELDDVAWTLGLLGALASVAVAILRSRVFEIDLVLNRTLVTLILGGMVLTAFLVAVTLLERMDVDDRLWFGLVAAASLLALSAYERVQHLVDRLLLAGAADPYAVVLRVGGRIDLATGPADALAILAEELRDALRLPYVGIRVTDGSLPPVLIGEFDDDPTELPITSQGEQVASLLVGLRRPVRSFATEERSLLEDACRRAGALVQAAVLVEDLQRSRERIVTAREEERRRLRHDLHDGLGPRLAGMALQLDSLTEQLAADADLHHRVERLRASMRAALAEVRHVVDDLRPPALDELGLGGALRTQIDAFEGTRTADGRIVRAVDLAVDPELPAFPAAVEVAAYRIVVEAVNNAVRHGDAGRVEVRLRDGAGELVVEVEDDGVGIDHAATPGVGLASMRERADELGGRFEVLAGAGGTLVRAHLPLRDVGDAAPSVTQPAPVATT